MIQPAHTLKCDQIDENDWMHVYYYFPIASTQLDLTPTKPETQGI